MTIRSQLDSRSYTDTDRPSHRTAPSFHTPPVFHDYPHLQSIGQAVTTTPNLRQRPNHLAYMEAHPEAGGVYGSELENGVPAANLHNVWPLTAATQPTSFQTLTIPASTNIAMNVYARSNDNDSPSTTCKPDDNSDMCAKPTTTASMKIPIILGIVIPIVGALLALLILHKKHVNKQKREDANDRHASLDFGLGQQGNKWNKQRGIGQQQPMNDVNMEEKGQKHKYGQSLDMMSPYILDPQLNQSSDSLRSLSRNIRNTEDPYGPVSDAASVRSARHNGSSIYTGKSGATAGLVGNAQGMGISPPPHHGARSPHGPSNLSPISPQGMEPAYFPNPNDHMENNSLSPGGAQESREPYMSQDAGGMRSSNNYLGGFISGGEDAKKTPQVTVSEVKDTQLSPFNDVPTIKMPEEPKPVASRSPSPPTFSLPNNTNPPRGASMPDNQPTGPLPAVPTPQIFVPQIAEPQGWKEDKYDEDDGFYVTPPSPKDDFAKKAAKRASRYSMDVPPEEYVKAGLGAPGVDANRISMGFRPLPPASMLAVESDDPEVRANRIRSFYKEYFDDSKPAPAGQYYEDYDNGTFHDNLPNTRPVQPYAEPMQRRAMTPPPGAQRFMGQHPSGALHGSLAQNNYGGPMPRSPGGPGGFRGPPDSRAQSRQGSMTSQQSQWRGPPGFGEPRPFSSASNRANTPRGRPMPPPEDLRTIPTPSMLKDDNFAIINAADFAPPTTYADRNRGRSQSPMGERRAYNAPKIVAHQLVSTYDELAPIPSPHLLRKSGTFTSLDFAPPKRVFKDQDTMSDAGSIRSNRSGISAMAQQAVRMGANRVSKLPQDQVFTKDDMSNVLKPSWDLRQ